MKGEVSMLAVALFGVLIGVILVLGQMGVFTAVASPYLDMMTNQEAVKGFVRLMDGMKDGCVSQSGTASRVSITPIDDTTIFAVGLIGPNTARYFSGSNVDDIATCSKVNAQICMDKDSKSKAQLCTSGYCYCLLKVKFSDMKKAPANANMVLVNTTISRPVTENKQLVLQGSGNPFEVYGSNIIAKEITFTEDVSLSRINFYTDFSELSNPNDKGTITLYLLGSKTVSGSLQPDFNTIIAISKFPSTAYDQQTSNITFDLNDIILEKDGHYFIAIESKTPDKMLRTFQLGGASAGSVWSSVNGGVSWSSSASAITGVVDYTSLGQSINAVRVWDMALAQEFRLNDNNAYTKIGIVECTPLSAIGCTNGSIPILPVLNTKASSGRTAGSLAWIQPYIVSVSSAPTLAPGQIPSTEAPTVFLPMSNNYDSISFVRAKTQNGGPDTYLKASISPNNKVSQYLPGQGSSLSDLSEEVSVI